MSRMTNDRRMRAFALMELLIAIGLLGIFMFVAAKVFGSTMKVIRTDAANDAITRSLDAGVARLRSDVWTATSIAMKDDMLSLSNPDGEVHWSMDPANHRLSRELNPSDGSERSVDSWAITSATVVFTVSADAVRVEITPSQNARAVTETLISQVLMSRNGS